MNNDTIITVVTWVLLIGFWIYYGRIFYRKVNENPSFEYDEPNYAATLGVLGTFLGIAYGLWEFNADDLTESIPALLIGMQTAFFTSIVGMILSLYMKSWQGKKREQYKSTEQLLEGTTLDDILPELKAMTSKIENMSYSLTAGFEMLIKSIASDGESTLIGQIKLSRSDANDNARAINEKIQSMHKELVDEFKEFAQTMAENNSKAFIEALNETMKDFNNKLQEQFGENFKQLNIAVGKLLDWQEHYRETIAETTENQKIIFTGIENAKNALAQIADDSKEIWSLTQHLSDLILTFKKYNEDLQISFHNLTQVGKAAENAIPKIDASIKRINDHTTVAIDKFQQEMDNMRNTIGTFIKAIIDSITTQKQSIEYNMKNLEVSTKDITQSISGEIKKLLQQNSNQLSSMTQQHINDTNKEMRVLGENLTAITKEFTIQYQNMLTQIAKLKGIIEQQSR